MVGCCLSPACDGPYGINTQTFICNLFVIRSHGINEFQGRLGVFSQRFVAFADLPAVSGFVVPDVKVGSTFDDRNMTEPLVKRLESSGSSI